MNPDEMTIEEKKMLGIWPDPGLVSFGLLPYLQRKKSKLSVTVLQDLKGENTSYLLDNLENLKRINVINDYKGDVPEKLLYEKNVPINNKIKTFTVQDDDAVIVLDDFINPDILFSYWKGLKFGGILAGNNHDREVVKLVLKKFRETYKITFPIKIINKTTWFIIKEKPRT